MGDCEIKLDSNTNSDVSKDPVPPKPINIGSFSAHICKNSLVHQLISSWEQIASIVELSQINILKLGSIILRGDFENAVFQLFKLWTNEEEGKNGALTLQRIADVFEEMNIVSMKGVLVSKYGSLNISISMQKPPKEVQGDNESLSQETPTGEEGAGKEKDKKAKKGFKLFGGKKEKDKKVKATGDKGKHTNGDPMEGEEEDEDEPTFDEVKDLPETNIKQLQPLVAPIRELETTLQIQGFLCKSIYCIAAIVPIEGNWIQKVALIAMEMLSLIRLFIEPGVAIKKKQFESVVRRFSTDPGLAPELISSMVTCGMFIPKEGDKKSFLLIEPSVKYAIEELQEANAFQKFLDHPYPSSYKVQEKILLSVSAAIEEHKDAAEQKDVGKKLSPHISHLIREIVFPLNHPGFKNVQGRIPKLIRFCSESVIAVAKQRYGSLPNISDEDLELFEKAYKKAQQERLDAAKAVAIGAAAGIGAAALTIGAAAALSDD